MSHTFLCTRYQSIQQPCTHITESKSNGNIEVLAKIVVSEDYYCLNLIEI